MRVLLVAGTWGRGDPWWVAGSPFVRALWSRGHRLAAENDESWVDDRAWRWMTSIDGLVGGNDAWEIAADHLAIWLDRHQEVEGIIAHSHGGQVAALALSYGARLGALVTVATPVREELATAYARAGARVNRWVHIYAPDDGWQAWGTYPLGSLWKLFRPVVRTIPAATENIAAPGLTHTTLLDPRQWALRGWFDALREQIA